jgi:hypothetical protein
MRRGGGSVAGVLDEPYSQLNPLSGVAVQGRQFTYARTVSILCSLAGLYDYSAELSQFRLKLPLLVSLVSPVVKTLNSGKNAEYFLQKGWSRKA